jgi:hypothetical protein
MIDFDVPTGYSLTSVLGWTAAPELAGDFNQDGAVDAADYVVWRKSSGTQDSYDVWRAHFSQSLGSGLGHSTSPVVPEPATMLLLIPVVAGWCIRGGREAQKYRQLINA